MKKGVVFAVLLLLVAFSMTVSAQGNEPITTRSAPPDPAQVRLVEAAGGFTRPLYATHAGDGSDRLFVVEQTGRIWIVQDGARVPEPFLDLSNVVTDVGQGYSEQGLLGLAFHPDYADNGRFFVNYTDRRGNTAIAEYRVSADDPDRADPGSGQILLTAEQPYPNHNGGQIAFGPDGYLYIGLGDGGSGGDPQGNAQNTWTLLGKILRLDVNGDEAPYLTPPDNPFTSGLGAGEIWAYGLRNPWRFSFDRATGDLYIADVGQDVMEEVNFQPADASGGQNYGWNRREGIYSYEGGADSPRYVTPVATYEHNQGCSITGGYVYRGEALPDLQGVYFYGDWCSGNVWALWRNEAGEWQNSLFWPNTGHAISSFGEDEIGELYLVDYGGGIYRFAATE